ncbi:hypothetical protein BU24DRAFT_488665 [Aaosphaeria arxii CBS 175.79]|uniref:Uncharacterized protein n=1 Tax=Aaosphaeria arxii CBS 175.79 TaxID=1450172 RepID=A0A6A5XZ37_9PLEO|nr:uncharacterized protein BU24DRAFT_488665 [Aaosphaeria arxii CBS 175.79]KAF2018558.1 hypothetical protein BU24DRAFT_488665 [Aaosphaeria arxii CBS 175.79]
MRAFAVVLGAMAAAVVAHPASFSWLKGYHPDACGGLIDFKDDFRVIYDHRGACIQIDRPVFNFAVEENFICTFFSDVECTRLGLVHHAEGPEAGTFLDKVVAYQCAKATEWPHVYRAAEEVPAKTASIHSFEPMELVLRNVQVSYQGPYTTSSTVWANPFRTDDITDEVTSYVTTSPTWTSKSTLTTSTHQRFTAPDPDPTIDPHPFERVSSGDSQIPTIVGRSVYPEISILPISDDISSDWLHPVPDTSADFTILPITTDILTYDLFSPTPTTPNGDITILPISTDAYDNLHYSYIWTDVSLPNFPDLSTGWVNPVITTADDVTILPTNADTSFNWLGPVPTTTDDFFDTPITPLYPDYSVDWFDLVPTATPADHRIVPVPRSLTAVFVPDTESRDPIIISLPTTVITL